MGILKNYGLLAVVTAAFLTCFFQPIVTQARPLQLSMLDESVMTDDRIVDIWLQRTNDNAILNGYNNSSNLPTDLLGFLGLGYHAIGLSLYLHPRISLEIAIDSDLWTHQLGASFIPLWIDLDEWLIQWSIGVETGIRALESLAPEERFYGLVSTAGTVTTPGRWVTGSLALHFAIGTNHGLVFGADPQWITFTPALGLRFDRFPGVKIDFEIGFPLGHSRALLPFQFGVVGLIEKVELRFFLGHLTSNLAIHVMPGKAIIANANPPVFLHQWVLGAGLLVKLGARDEPEGGESA